ncbi:hypothetical protein BOTNAR_0581g00020 [Botryotinia narcissicola]|uniref:aldehyde dehydrogenase (NAD(+)) n=1 Tax=Botryotinia narcissicola TaxID=278944 RepID=A0A4Z1HNM2_9HELO|nr:hypothetical protein BOTNAR_0581g00020 [Botryotinia narcissicola]
MERDHPLPDGPFAGWKHSDVEKLMFTLAAGATAVVGCILYGTIRLIEWYNAEPILRYSIAELKAPEDKKILENPSIKTAESSDIQCYAPATGQFLGYVTPSTPEDIDRAIEKANVAQKKWARTTFTQRRQVLRSMMAYILDHQDELCRVACLDSGKTMIDAALGEILVTVEKLNWTLEHGEKALSPSRRPTNLLMMYKKNTVQYEPLGVVAALVSWNYPLHNLLGPIISAIFSGNGIVVKASENTAWSAQHFSLIARGALYACGHDSNLIQSHPRISHITFIGSRPVAKLVAAAASKPLIPVVAELGGKDAVVVMNSAVKDLPRITEILLRGTFQAAGQNCIGIERIIGLPDVYDNIVTTLEPRIRALRVSAALDSTAESPVDKLIAGAVSDGARLLVGGKRYNHPVHRSGHYFSPTLLVDVTPEMAIANEECFGPICVVMRAKNPEDACNIANQPDFGLGASVFGSKDWELNDIVKNIKAGMVAINDFGAYYAVQLPFGGVEGRGYGRFAGEKGLRGLCNIKAVCEDRWPWSPACTAIPPPLRYPIPDTTKGFAFTKAVVDIGYGAGVKGKWRGIKVMLGMN